MSTLLQDSLSKCKKALDSLLFNFFGYSLYIVFLIVFDLGVPPSVAFSQEIMKFTKIEIPAKIRNLYCPFVREDSLGFIWIASSHGVFRFDGYKMLQIDECGTFTSIIATSFFVDSKQNIWVGTEGKGIYCKALNQTCFKKASFKGVNALEKAYVSEICEDGQGRIWFAAPTHGIFVFDTDTQSINPIPEYKTYRGVNAMIYDPNFRVMRIMGGGRTPIYSISEDNLRDINYYKFPFKYLDSHNNAIVILPDGTIWASVYGTGLYYLPLGHKEWKEFKHPGFDAKFIRSCVGNHTGDIIIGMGTKGILMYDSRKKQLKQVEVSDKSRNSLNITATFFFVSRYNDLWVSGFPSGLQVAYSERIKSRRIAPAECDRCPQQQLFPVLSLYHDNDSSIWIGTDGVKLYRYFPKENRLSLWKLTDNDPNVIKTIYKDKKGRLWFGTFLEGMVSYDPKTKEAKKYTDLSPIYRLENNFVWAIDEDLDGNFWVSCLSGGAIRFSQEGKQRRVFFKPKPNGHTKKIIDLHCDSKGNMWFAFEQDGLALLERGSKKIKRLTSKHGLSSDNVLCVYEDKRGRIWVGTSDAGVNLWQNQKFVSYRRKDGLLADDVQSIIEAGNEMLWVVASTGITQIKMLGEQLQVIGREQLQDGNMISNLSACLGDNKSLFIGGIAGITQLQQDPDQPLHHPKVLIANIKTDFSTDSENKLDLLSQANSRRMFILEKGVQGVILELSSSDLGNLHQTDYQYKMSGFSKKWVTLSEGEHRAVFAHLEPGRYRFSVRCRNNYSDWSPELRLSILVKVPFWETKWFGFLAVLVAILALVGFIINRNRLLREKLKQKNLEKEKEALVQENQTLFSEVETQNYELLAKSAEAAQVSRKLETISDLLAALDKGSELERKNALRLLKNHIKFEVDSDDQWNEFQTYFDKTHQDYAEQLLKLNKGLTSNDIRLAIFIKLGMSTKEIGQLLNITDLAIQKSRYRMKKKLGLNKEEDLISFLKNMSLGQ